MRSCDPTNTNSPVLSTAAQSISPIICEPLHTLHFLACVIFGQLGINVFKVASPNSLEFSAYIKTRKKMQRYTGKCSLLIRKSFVMAWKFLYTFTSL
jgi:hypothetical protein